MKHFVGDTSAQKVSSTQTSFMDKDPMQNYKWVKGTVVYFLASTEK